jgi:hypothetical protein
MAYTNIDDPSAYFQAKTYTGTSGIHDVTLDGNSDMQPDWVWFKNRTVGYSHQLYDSSRGVNKPLYSDLSNAEGSITNGLTRFDPDGFRVSSAAAINENEIVCWNWKANGGTTASNTDGNTTTTVQANTDAGFSIVTYTGTGSASQTMGHGLGVTPNIIITKRRDGAANWVVCGNVGGLIYGTNRFHLNNTYALTADNNEVTAASSTTFTGGGSNAVNGNGSTYVAYCFAEKQGYSKFGKYVGNGSTNGSFVYTGFKPALVITKKRDQVSNWTIYDNKRDPFNVADTVLLPNATNADQTVINFDFVSNGFKCRNSGSENENATTYIYMAFAENPFTTSTGIPTTAR